MQSNDNISQLLKDSINRYIDHKIPTGSFLQAVLANDLTKAAYKADYENRAKLAVIAIYINAVVPEEARGSYENVKRWLELKV